VIAATAGIAMIAGVVTGIAAAGIGIAATGTGTAAPIAAGTAAATMATTTATAGTTARRRKPTTAIPTIVRAIWPGGEAAIFRRTTGAMWSATIIATTCAVRRTATPGTASGTT